MRRQGDSKELPSFSKWNTWKSEKSRVFLLSFAKTSYRHTMCALLHIYQPFNYKNKHMSGHSSTNSTRRANRYSIWIWENGMNCQRKVSNFWTFKPSWLPTKATNGRGVSWLSTLSSWKFVSVSITTFENDHLVEEHAQTPTLPHARQNARKELPENVEVVNLENVRFLENQRWTEMCFSLDARGVCVSLGG